MFVPAPKWTRIVSNQPLTTPSSFKDLVSGPDIALNTYVARLVNGTTVTHGILHLNDCGQVEQAIFPIPTGIEVLTKKDPKPFEILESVSKNHQNEGFAYKWNNFVDREKYQGTIVQKEKQAPAYWLTLRGPVLGNMNLGARTAVFGVEGQVYTLSGEGLNELQVLMQCTGEKIPFCECQLCSLEWNDQQPIRFDEKWIDTRSLRTVSGNLPWPHRELLIKALKKDLASAGNNPKQYVGLYPTDKGPVICQVSPVNGQIVGTFVHFDEEKAKPCTRPFKIMARWAGHLTRHSYWWINLHKALSDEGRNFVLVQIFTMWGYIVPVVVQEGLQNKSLGQLNFQMGEAMFMLNGVRNFLKIEDVNDRNRVGVLCRTTEDYRPEEEIDDVLEKLQL